MILTWGLSGFGEWILITAIPAYLMLSSDLGLIGVAVNDVPRLRSEGKDSDAYLLFRITFVGSILIALMFMCICLVFILLFDSWSGIGIVKNFELAPSVVLISCLSIVAFQFIGMSSAGFRGEDSSVEFSFLLLIYYGLLLLLSVSLLILDFDMFSYSFTLMIYMFSYSVFLSLRLHFKNPSYFGLPTFIELKGLRILIGKALGHSMFPVLHAVQNQGVLLIIGATSGAGAVAMFQTLRVLTNGFKSIVGVVAAPVMIEIPRLVGQRAIPLLASLLSFNTKFSFGSLLIFSGGIILFGSDLYSLWLGDEAIFDGNLLIILLSSLWFFIYGNTSTLFLLCTNNIQSIATPLLISSLILMLLTWLLAVWFGVYGAAVGVVGFEAVVAFLTVRGGRRVMANYLN